MKKSLWNAVPLAAVLCLLPNLGFAQTAPKATTAPMAKPAVKVTMKQAEATSLKRFPGKIVGKTELENEDGKWQYAVMVRSNKMLREVMVNAMTGKIDAVEVTTDEKEKAEAKAEAKMKGKKAAPTKMEKKETGEEDEKDEKDEKPEAKKG